ncbi:MAG: 3-dehydroquinate synthase, partial [Clostridiales bacterium]|nr:3-dehydroquinate synthase [Clostridiales bacterium]
VDLGGLKNQVGAFHQPRLVLIDPDVLSTLPAATLADGAAEAVKYGVLGDTELFERLSRSGWTADAEWVIERCVTAKAALVAADERDTGSRQLLNLGHTLGHAIEKCSDFRFSHGQAVAVGMIYAARIARSMGLCGPEVEAGIAAALTAGGLPLAAPYGAAELAAAAMADKKRAGGEITLVLPREIGRCELVRVPVADMEELARVALGA